jgi:type I restriction enzyme S subunit
MVPVVDLLSAQSDGRLIHQGWSPQCEQDSSTSNSVWAVLKTTAIQDGRFFPEHNKRLPNVLEPRAILEVSAGDLLLTCAGPRARCAVPCLVRATRPRLMISGKMYRMRANEEVAHSRYIEAALRATATQERLDAMKTGMSESGMNLTHARFARLQIPVAPLPEQKRIADKLDALLARVDACRERLDRVPAILKRFRQSVLATATSGELTREWREERGIDEAWDELPLEEIIEGKPRNGYSPKAVDHATPVKSLTLTATTTGRFRGEHFKYIDEQIPADSHLWLRPGDVLIQRANTLEYVGVSAIFDGPENTFIYPDLMMKCRANKRVLPAFLHVVLSSQPVRKYFRENATGTAGNMPKINQQTVLSAPAVVPSIEEQKQIVARTTELLGMADALERAHTAALAKVTKLTPSALAKVFRGELVAQDPNDEPASVLLAKLKTEQANAAAKPSRRRPKTPGKRPTMSNTDKDSIKAAILKLKTDRFSFDELRAQVSGDYDSLKAALFELLEEPSPVVRQVFDEKAKAMHLVRVRP